MTIATVIAIAQLRLRIQSASRAVARGRLTSGAFCAFCTFDTFGSSDRYRLSHHVRRAVATLLA